ncbi:MAG: replicative DNA helicase [Rickettsiales bacterium]|nr:MAG: replicative DNA helicase [Rickettsiales bacterium]
MTKNPLQEIELTRKQPANIHAEQMLLGAILINSNFIEQVNEFLKAEHFYEQIHQKIYNAIRILAEKGLTATPVTLKSMLDKDPLYEAVNGHEYIIKLTTLAMVVINPNDYGRIIYDLAIKRNLIAIGEDIVNNAYNSTLEQGAFEQLESAESQLYLLASEGMKEKSFVSIKDTVLESLSSINRAMKNSDHVTGVSTGLNDLDNKLSGFQNSDLIIIAGRPSMGKTAFAINFAFNACKALQRKNTDSDKPPAVGFFSLEMSSEQLATRLLSMMARVDSTQLRNGKVSEEHYNDLRKAASELSQMPFFIDDTPALTISAVRTRARKLKRKHNLGIMFVDYLQLLRGTSNSNNRVLEISEITQGLKAIAKELNIPVIALSQLSRAVEQRIDNKPMLSDLRESGSIEQDADLVMFLYREEYYLKRTEPASSDAKYNEWMDKLNKCHNVAEVIVAKHRNGSVGNVRLFYEDRFSSVGNLSKTGIYNN